MTTGEFVMDLEDWGIPEDTVMKIGDRDVAYFTHDGEKGEICLKEETSCGAEPDPEEEVFKKYFTEYRKTYGDNVTWLFHKGEYIFFKEADDDICVDGAPFNMDIRYYGSMKELCTKEFDVPGSPEDVSELTIDGMDPETVQAVYGILSGKKEEK